MNYYYNITKNKSESENKSNVNLDMSFDKLTNEEDEFLMKHRNENKSYSTL